MKSLINDVIAFHMATDTPHNLIPQIPSKERIDLRGSLISEEVGKELLPLLRELMENRDPNLLTELADALADTIYVVVGTAVEFGIPLDKVWDIIQCTNMAKVNPATGKVIKREDGKVLKPEGWQPPEPEIAVCLNHHGAEVTWPKPERMRNAVRAKSDYDPTTQPYDDPGR